MSWDMPAAWSGSPDSIGVDFDWLEYSIRYDLPEVAAKNVGSVLAKVTGKARPPYHNATMISSAGEIVLRLPMAWQRFLWQQVVSIGMRTMHRQSNWGAPSFISHEIKGLMH